MIRWCVQDPLRFAFTKNLSIERAHVKLHYRKKFFIYFCFGCGVKIGTFEIYIF